MTTSEKAPKKFLVIIVAGTMDAIQSSPFVVQAVDEEDACDIAKAHYALLSSSPVLCYTAHLLNLLLSSPFYCLSEAVRTGTAKALAAAQGVTP